MKRLARLGVGIWAILWAGVAARGEIRIVADHNDNEHATAGFKFKTAPSPAKTSAASSAKFTLIDGARDENGGDLDALHDGKLPTEPDQPAANFFFDAGTDGGRLAIDLGAIIDIKQVNTYSWHPDTRAAQVYTLYASDGAAAGFKPAPAKEIDPATCGWKLIAKVDTRPKADAPGGQYGVSISDSNGTLGKIRYLLFAVSRAEADDDFGNTFYSEIAVVDAAEFLGDRTASGPRAGVKIVVMDEGKYQATIDTTETPDLTEWAEKELAPVVAEWYPKIVKMLPSDGFEAPRQFSITFRKDKEGVADTAGTRINCAAAWFRKSLQGEARGAIVHELVHVVQQYGAARRRNPNAQRNPGWLVEGIPDYIRWYKYEPQSHGANISRRGLASARYDGSYRVSANFLNWAIDKYDNDLIEHLNAFMREGKYSEEVWKKLTGKTVQDLGDEWKAGLEKAAK